MFSVDIFIHIGFFNMSCYNIQTGTACAIAYSVFVFGAALAGRITLFCNELKSAHILFM